MHNPDDLALYYYDGCPWCMRVTSALDRLGVRVEMRNILSDAQHMRDLVEARGRRTVPVMRIRREGRDEWMPESADIVAYLEQRFGAAR
jgi:glutaredoxin 2